MDNYRLVLFLALAFVLMLLWQAWEQEHGTPPAQPVAEQNGPLPSDSTVPSAPPATASAPTAPQPKSAALPHGESIEVVTDLLRAHIDTDGGDLRRLWLLTQPVSVDKPNEPFQLFQDGDDLLYVAQSGLIGNDRAYPTHKTRYRAAATRYTLAPGNDTVRVPLYWRAPDGVEYTKTFVFQRNSYAVNVEFSVNNTTKREWAGFAYAQFLHSHVEPPGMFAVPTYTGGAVYTATDKYHKVSFADMASKPLKRETEGGWVAMLQHYFVAAWIPPAEDRSQFYTDVLPGQRYVIGYKELTPLTVAAGATGRTSSTLYAGPKEQKRLTAVAPGLELTVDYGWLTVISAPLFWLLQLIHRLVGNWGFAIILLTVLIKLVFYPLSATSYKSMAQMKKLQPKLQSLKERYGDDRQKLNQAMMELYKTEKINPLGGCLPIVIQIPVFIALYWVLLESVEMRQAPFVFWIRDLSTPDPYFVLPIIMGVTMYVQQWLNPQPADPVQKKVFMVMPLVFGIFFLFFPAGLVLYWVVNNLLSILQQWRITRVIAAKGS